MRALLTDAGVAAYYSGVVKGLVVDRGTPSGVPTPPQSCSIKRKR